MHVLSYGVLSYVVLSYGVLSYVVLSYGVLSYVVLSYGVLWCAMVCYYGMLSYGVSQCNYIYCNILTELHTGCGMCLMGLSRTGRHYNNALEK